MNVSLTPELERLIQARVASGMYGNASEVVREALRMLFEKEIRIEMNHQKLINELERAIESADQGNYNDVSVEDIFEAAEERHRKNQKSA